MSTRKVACIGDACVDYIATGITELPAWGDTTPMRSFSEPVVGGMSLNVAITLQQLGGFEVLPMSVIGTDHHASTILSQLADRGFDRTQIDRGLKQDTDFRTVVVLCLAQESDLSERLFIHLQCDPSNTGTPTIDDLRDESDMLSEFDVLHFSCVGHFTALTKPDISHLLSGIQDRREVAGLERQIIVADTLPVEALENRNWQSAVAPFMRKVDYFLPSDTEASKLTGADQGEPAEAAELLRDRYGIPNICIKLHERGAYWLDETGASGFVDAPAILDATDTTGAGDAWCAGFIAATAAEGHALKDACAFGNVTASHWIRSRRSTFTLPTYQTVADQVLDLYSHLDTSQRSDKQYARAFISFFKDDADFAEKIATDLRSIGYEVSTSSPEPMDDQAIKAADHFIPIISAGALSSPRFVQELKLADADGVTSRDRTIPILRDSSIRDRRSAEPSLHKIRRNQQQTIDISSWSGEVDTAEVARAVDAIASRSKELDTT